MTQRRLIAKLVLSCAGSDCASLAIAHSHVNAGVVNIEREVTYTDGGPRTPQSFCGTHVGRVVAVESKDGEFPVSVESAGDGGAECGMEGAARLGTERDVRLERFSATEDISYPTCRALRGRKTQR